MVTRSRTQGSSLVEKVMDLGGNPIEVPTIRIEKIKDNVELEQAIKEIQDYTYLILSSQNAVDIFFDQLDELGFDARALAHLKVCAIGSATAKAVKDRGIKADLIPSKFVSEALCEELRDVLKPEDRVLIPRAKNARDVLVETLGQICSVHEVHTYESVMDTSMKEDVTELLTNHQVDYVTFASSATVKNFVKMLGTDYLEKLNQTKVISIGPVTSKTLQDLKIEVYKEAKEASIDALVEAMIGGH